MIHALVLALALAQAAPEPVSVTPARFAEAIQGMVGQTYDGGVAIARIHADGPVVVITLDGPPGWRSTAAARSVPGLVVAGFCEDRDFEYFVNGNAMRVDTSESGGALRSGPVIRACPPPAPGAHPQ
jgi:hypothetical protein